ncbi:TRAP transporter substrate-binding protein [Nitrogeniibacter mangrovi]|uniref:TRAP transporter substrate-binding protein n=1 Tax=Nitrogeniibacter mangrovi TaxID=2016596 RepID=A0A6C1B6V4_9RHOO|nr:TRAP transporter substrate-binding protein [Nitrogeniibacter mangrovi]QID19197.1 TRAP transporter substrate-binding protein [Nitrogeniibacter mangrovi]
MTQRNTPRSLVLLAGLMLAAGAVHAADKLRWKVPNAFPSHLPALGDNVQMVADMLKTASDGQIQFKIFEPGNLVPPLELSDAVRDKTIDAGYTWLGYDAGKIPSAPLFSARPFGMEPWEYTAWWYNGGGKALAEDVYGKRNIHPILCGITGPETAGWFRKEIKTMDDLKGLKIRFAGLGGQVMQKAGASVTLLPGSEIFQALEKGAIDATEFAMPAVDQKLGFDKVAKYNYFPGWHQTYTAFHLIINKQVWDALQPSSRALFDTACTAGVMRNLSKGEAIQGDVIRGFEAKGVKTEKVPTKMLHALKKLTDEVMAEQSAKDADFKRVYDSQEAFSKSYQTWKGLAYLPRDFNDEKQ